LNPYSAHYKTNTVTNQLP